MDPENLFYLAIAAFWFVSQMASLAKKRRRPEGAPAPPGSHRREAPADGQGIGILVSLRRLSTRLEQDFADLDERVGLSLSNVVERDFREETTRLGESLQSALSDRDPARIVQASGAARSHLARWEQVSRSARALSALRRQPETLSERRVADRLVEEVTVPLRSFTEGLPGSVDLGPPIVVVGDPPPEDGARSSPLAASTIFVPRSVSVDLLHWSLVAHEISRYVEGVAPGLYEEIYSRLRLGVTQAELSTSQQALTRLLFGSFLGRILGDATGASLFGPVYLRALAKLYAEPGSSRVSTIYLDAGGMVHPEPPAHLRLHLTAQWLADLGLAGEAGDVLREWDEMHGHPEAFSFHGTVGRLPAASLLSDATELMEQLFHLETGALGSRKLADVPGLSDGSRLDRKPGSARALLAQAMRSVLAAPASASSVRSSLYAGLGSPAADKPRVLTKPQTTGSASTRFGAREVAEALLLGDVLLAPPSARQVLRRRQQPG